MQTIKFTCMMCTVNEGPSDMLECIGCPSSDYSMTIEDILWEIHKESDSFNCDRNKIRRLAREGLKLWEVGNT